MAYIEKRKNYPRVAEWRQRNPERHREQQRRAFEAKAEIVRILKSEPCTDCGNIYPFYVMEFDHVRGQKSFQIGGSLGSRSLEAILAEIEKCDLVCSNCHAIRTHVRRQGWHKERL